MNILYLHVAIRNVIIYFKTYKPKVMTEICFRSMLSLRMKGFLKCVLAFQTLILSICIPTTITAQHFKADIFLQNHVDNAPIIVEGKVVEQTTFMDANTIYTKSKVKVYKKFKGDFKENFFYLLHAGGELGDITQTCSHCFTLGSKVEGLFFLTPATSEIAKRHTCLSFFESGSTSLIYYVDDSLKINKIALSKNYNYTHIEKGLLQQIEQRVGKKRERIAYTEYEENYLRILTSRGLKPQILDDGDGLEYKVGSPTMVSEQGLQYLSFDVYLKSFAFDYKMLKSVIVFDYSGNLLPPNAIAQNIITVTKSAAFQSNDYQTQLLDATDSKMSIALGAASSSLNLHEVSDIFEKMCNIKINIAQLNPFGRISAYCDKTEMLQENKYKENITATPTPFDFIIAEDSLTGSLQEFLPLEYTFSPSSVTAGTFDGNDIITITGADLGDINECSQPPIKVTYTDAFNGGSRLSAILPFMNYTEWGIVPNSNPIQHYVKVRVPGAGADYSDGRTTYPGTGKIRVERRNDGQVGESANALTIRYCIKSHGVSVSNALSGCRSNPNYRYVPSQFSPIPIKMADASSNNSGCYIIRFDNSFNAPNRVGAKAAFTRALNRWRCSTGINFVINDNLTNQSGVNVLVSFGTLDDALTLATTTTNEQNCTDNSNYITRYVKDFTIVFNRDLTFNYGDFSNFETVTLHELGHAHLLLHTNSPSDLMYYQLNTTNIATNDAQASRFVVNRSSVNSAGSCKSALIPVPSANCRTNNADIAKNTIAFSVYPNPTETQFTINIPDFIHEEIQVIVFNSLGQVVYNQKRLTNQIRLEAEQWVRGLYCVTLVQGNKMAT